MAIYASIPAVKSSDQALVHLGRALKDAGYRFVTITPASHARVNRRAGARAATLRDVFGWNRPFGPDALPRALLDLLVRADAVASEERGLMRSRVRFSSAGELLFVHSAFPTDDAHSVFFGPDTYRFLSLLGRLQPRARRAVDVGCGSGAGGIAIATSCGRIVLTDVNGKALRFAAVNAAINFVENVELAESDALRDVRQPFDLVISNPPYLVDDAARLYRDGGGRFGEQLSVEIVRQSIERLPRGGRLILYTASAIVDGVDTFAAAVEPLIAEMRYRYEEIDPDVHGEELERHAYESADRLAVVALDLTC